VAYALSPPLESIRSQAFLSSQAAEEQAKVLEDDPTAYDYDELYDNLKQKDTARKSILEQEKKKRQVRPSLSRVLIDKDPSSLLTHAFFAFRFSPSTSRPCWRRPSTASRSRRSFTSGSCGRTERRRTISTATRTNS
jgi:hypothetical protein